jgi:glycosyltransferase involved in cell wall biosynthesis
MTHSLVSIIVPCYNQGEYLRDSLNSILDQSYQRWECIIVNDGSTDNTENIVLKWLKKDSRFKYLKKKNGGLSSARNAGLKIAMGDYIQFLDSDDIILPKKFEFQIDSLQIEAKNDVAICDYYYSEEADLYKEKSSRLTPFPNSGNMLKHLIIDWEERLSVPCNCFLFSAKYFKQNQILFDENLPNHEDLDCWIRIFALKPKVVLNKEILAVYRIRNNSMSRDSNLMQLGFIQVLQKHHRIFNRDLTMVEMIQKRLNSLQNISEINLENQEKKSLFSKKLKILFRFFKTIGKKPISN